MNTKHISYILEIAEQKNITKAAEKLYVSQSTLSQCLANLESELGTPLFYRYSKELVPTPAGLCYLEGARQMLEIKKQVYDNIAKMTSNMPLSFTIGISSQGGLRVFSKVSALYKDIYPNVTFNIIEDHSLPMIKMLNAGKLDMAILAVDNTERISSAYERLLDEELFLAFPDTPGFERYFNDDGVLWDTLNQAPFILSPKGTIIRELEDVLCSAHKIQPYVICEISSKTAVISMLSEGLGISLIPQSAKREIEGIRYFSVSPQLYRYHVIAYMKRKTPEREKETFIRLVKENYNF
ncbi:LysR family transcriptional regulator [Clostridium sp. MCC353]|uniref:LysR family transcriptional regulator n=1 Tax=Clostridium sp. MCC353 TaxID=2592646 RepID=UPI001C02B374|nr:LysR family transcriptional regulator [Clostridium sp. MCC353]